MRTWLALLSMGLAILVVGRIVERAPAIVVDDRTGGGIEAIILIVGDDVPRRAALDPAARAGQPLPPHAEGSARLHVRFADGAERTFDVGWVSPAARHDLHLTLVSPDSIRVRRGDRGD